MDNGSNSPDMGDDVVTSHTEGVKPLESVLRLSDNGVEFIQRGLSGHHEDNVNLGSIPQIDTSSFAEYIEIPRGGPISHLINRPIRIGNGMIPFKRYVEGSPNAHHYPLGLLPRKFSYKLAGDIIVTSYALDDRDYRMEGSRRVMLSALPTLKRTNCEVLLQKLYGKVTVLIIFSGDIPYSDYKSGLEWHRALDFVDRTHFLLNYPCPVGMSYFHKRYVASIASSLVDRVTFSCLTSKLSFEDTIGLHQYRRQFTSVLLLDKFGYIRWHAAGRPTRESTFLLKESYERLVKE
eukprot:XP_001610622.1 hypothetical protein [Babesia bovis T2Bo]